MVCSHSLQLWKWIKCTEQFKSHTCWLKWLSIPNWLCEHSQTQSFLPRYKLVSSCLSVCLSHNQTHQQKDMLKAEYRGCSASHALWKAQKHYSLSKAWVGTVVYSYWDLQRNEVKLHTTPIRDNHHYLPCYHVKSACHVNVLMLILIRSNCQCPALSAGSNFVNSSHLNIYLVYGCRKTNVKFLTELY